jgi:hypothetical protein
LYQPFINPLALTSLINKGKELGNNSWTLII